MLEQKQAMQLIYEWGYTPARFEKYLLDQKARAKEIGEAVGGTMYSSLLALCRYAMSGDADNSVCLGGVNINNPLLKKVLEDTEIKEMLEDEEFSDGVLSSVYDVCHTHKSIKDAEIALRERVIQTVAPMIMQSIVEMGSGATERIMECIIGLDHAMQSSDVIDAEDATKNLTKLIYKITSYHASLRACRETEYEPFNELVDSVVGDIDELISEVNQNILSIVDQPPHVWASYAIKFGRMMAAFMIAMALGYITYEDYESVLSEFKDAIKNPEDKNTFFGRN